jgi:hypothetical protein
MTTKPSTTGMTAVDVACPICDAQPGRPCRTVVNTVNGRATREVRLVHGYRVQAAEEAVR